MPSNFLPCPTCGAGRCACLLRMAVAGKALLHPSQPASSSPCVFCMRPAVPEEGQGKELQELKGPRAEAVTDFEHRLWQLCVCSPWRGARQSKQPARCRASGESNLFVTSLSLFSPFQAILLERMKIHTEVHILYAQRPVKGD